MASRTALLILGIFIAVCIAAVSSDVEFKLITRNSQKGETDILPDASNLNSTGFINSNATVVIVHGFEESHETGCVVAIRDAYLNATRYNVILVNWRTLAEGPYYETAAMNTNVAADDLAKFLDGLILQIDNGTRKDFTVVGFNLGAQVVGLAAKRMKQGPLPRIIALDPSKPLFEFKDDSKRLASKDAEFLLTIHTAGGFIAFSKPIGHVDFYPNGGIAPQPPCSEEGSEKVTAMLCSHQMSCLLFSESLYNPMAFPATQCDSWSHFKEGHCNGNTKTFMGAYTPVSSRGSFFLETNRVPPFGQGKYEDSLKHNVTNKELKKCKIEVGIYRAKDENEKGSNISQGYIVVFITITLGTVLIVYFLYKECVSKRNVHIPLKESSKDEADGVLSSILERP